MKKAYTWLGLWALLAVLPTMAAALTLGQIQTFDNAAHGWVYGAGPVLNNPTLFPTALGGQGGATDPYLLLQSTGTTGPLSRLTAQNFGLWAGNYTAAGVDRIRMDVNNFSVNVLSLRLALLEFAGPPVGIALSQAINVPANSGWHSIEFDISAAALTGVLGNPATTLLNVGELRIVHDPAGVFGTATPVPAIAASLGIDNITAIPEPATLTLVGAGLAAAAVFARRRAT